MKSAAAARPCARLHKRRMDTLARVASERSKGLDALDAIEHQSDHLALSC